MTRIVIALTLPKDGRFLLRLNSLTLFTFAFQDTLYCSIITSIFITFNFEEHTTHVVCGCITERVFMCILV